MNQHSNYFRLLGTAVLVLGFTACSADTDDAAVVIDDGTATVAADAQIATPPETPSTTMGAAATGAWINPNSAPATELMTIAGMTQPVADALIAGRPYASMTKVNAVLAKTMSEKQRDSAYTRLWMPIDLNKATGEEMQLIPGVGPKMEHEFEEYRPYTDMARFRREIGKYVDAAEVARLERYVEIR